MTDRSSSGSDVRNLPRLVSVERAISELGIGRTLFYELVEAKTINTVKIGRRRLVPSEEIERFVSTLSKQG
jgi:excisionase family DNA binding protein